MSEPTHPLFDSSIKWMSPHEISDIRINQLADDKFSTPKSNTEKGGEIKRLADEFDKNRKKFKRKGVAKYER